LLFICSASLFSFFNETIGSATGSYTYRIGLVRYLSVSSWMNWTRWIFFLFLSLLCWTEEELLSIGACYYYICFFNILTKGLDSSLYSFGAPLIACLNFYSVFLSSTVSLSFKIVTLIDSSNIFFLFTNVFDRWGSTF
jgi:hypothetical protein